MAGLLAAPFIKRRKPSKKSQITDRARADHPSHRHLSTSAASLASSSRTNGLRPVMTATASNSDRDPSSRNSKVPSCEAWAGYASHRATSAFAVRPPRDVATPLSVRSLSKIAHSYRLIMTGKQSSFVTIEVSAQADIDAAFQVLRSACRISDQRRRADRAKSRKFVRCGSIKNLLSQPS
jgi:hypothetical protein